MKTFNGILAAVAAAGIAIAPAIASAETASPASRLSITHARAGAPVGKSSKLGAAVPTTTLISIGVLAALTAIVLVATDKKSAPASP